LTPRHGRRFGVTVGSAFLVLSAAAWWRSHPQFASAAAAAGGLLVLAGLVVPTRLGRVERAWMALAHAISRVTTPIVMGAMYVGVFLPVGVLRRTLGGNPLVHDERGGSFWRDRPEGERRSKSMRRQF
jgi:hypothetical protein